MPTWISGVTSADGDELTRHHRHFLPRAQGWETRHAVYDLGLPDSLEVFLSALPPALRTERSTVPNKFGNLAELTTLVYNESSGGRRLFHGTWLKAVAPILRNGFIESTDQRVHECTHPGVYCATHEASSWHTYATPVKLAPRGSHWQTPWCRFLFVVEAVAPPRKEWNFGEARQLTFSGESLKILELRVLRGYHLFDTGEYVMDGLDDADMPDLAYLHTTLQNADAASAEQPATHAEQPATHAEQPATHAEQTATHAEQPATYAEQPATHAEQPATHADAAAFCSADWDPPPHLVAWQEHWGVNQDGPRADRASHSTSSSVAPPPPPLVVEWREHHYFEEHSGRTLSYFEHLPTGKTQWDTPSQPYEPFVPPVWAVPWSASDEKLETPSNKKAQESHWQLAVVEAATSHSDDLVEWKETISGIGRSMCDARNA